MLIVCFKIPLKINNLKQQTTRLVDLMEHVPSKTNLTFSSCAGVKPSSSGTAFGTEGLWYLCPFTRWKTIFGAGPLEAGLSVHVAELDTLKGIT